MNHLKQTDFLLFCFVLFRYVRQKQRWRVDFQRAIVSYRSVGYSAGVSHVQSRKVNVAGAVTLKRIVWLLLAPSNTTKLRV